MSMSVPQQSGGKPFKIKHINIGEGSHEYQTEHDILNLCIMPL